MSYICTQCMSMWLSYAYIKYIYTVYSSILYRLCHVIRKNCCHDIWWYGWIAWSCNLLCNDSRATMLGNLRTSVDGLINVLLTENEPSGNEHTWKIPYHHKKQDAVYFGTQELRMLNTHASIHLTLPRQHCWMTWKHVWHAEKCFREWRDLGRWSGVTI